MSGVEPAPGEAAVALRDGTTLALSGGGLRATLFHAGSLIRLNECGLLQGLARVSSVSGGAIAAGRLAVAWADLDFQNSVATRLGELVIRPLDRIQGRCCTDLTCSPA